MGMTFRPPASTGGQDDVKALYSYLFQLAEQLNVAFENVDAQGGSAAYKAMQMAGGTARGEVDATTAEAYQNLKSLIIKTATQVTSNIRKQYLDLAQEYIAQSEYGTYAEYLQAQIELGADGVVANWDQTNMITTSVADFNEYIAQSDIYMQIGIVRENQDGTMEAGVVVGKNFQKVTIDGVETITSKDVYMLLTAEQISFWQDGVKRSSLSLEDFFVNKAYIDEVQTSLISSKTFGEGLDISSNSSIELLNDRLALIVSSESSSTSLVLTDKMLQAISDRVELVAGTPDKLQNSSVTITPSMVQIATPLFSVQNESTGMTLDEDGLSAEYVSAPNLAEKYTGGSNVYAGGTYYPSLAALASELNGRLLTQNLTITLLADVMGNVEFANICGGKVIINGNGCTVRGRMNIENCSAMFELNNITFAHTGNEYSMYSNSRVMLSACVFNMSTPGFGPVSCIFVDEGSRVYAYGCEFYSDNGRIITVANMSYCALNSCTGSTGGQYAFHVTSGSELHAYGGYPSGGVYGGSDDASVVELFGISEPGITPPAPPTITEQVFTCTSSDTCWGNSNWDGSGDIRQGYAGSINRGFMWFSGLASAIYGKTITSATLQLTRVPRFGGTRATTIYAYYTEKTNASGTQSISMGYGGTLSGIKERETKVFDLPVEIVQRIADYGYGGIAIYSGETEKIEGHDYSRNYCKIYGANSAYAPVLTVTYQ